jgi:hypothetical protein
MYINIISPKKIHQKVQPTTLVLKYMKKKSSFVTILFCEKYIQALQCLLDFLKVENLIQLKIKSNPIQYVII